ncbi:hypothetical protein HZA97_08965 [Candidatus Woesearchaeota archaeon]|nr:hypothetical protein [Candidatus Woesearchaeota archaeon]
MKTEPKYLLEKRLELGKIPRDATITNRICRTDSGCSEFSSIMYLDFIYYVNDKGKLVENVFSGLYEELNYTEKYIEEHKSITESTIEVHPFIKELFSLKEIPDFVTGTALVFISAFYYNEISDAASIDKVLMSLEQMVIAVGLATVGVAFMLIPPLYKAITTGASSAWKKYKQLEKARNNKDDKNN